MISSTKKLLLAASLGVATLAATPASAAVDVCAGSGQQCAPQTNTNVLLTSGSNLTTVNASFNGGGATLGGTFTSTTDRLNADASGQAVVTATTGLLNNLTFMVSGSTFTVATFNLIGDGSVTIFGTAVDGTAFSEAFTLGNGSNFFGIVANEGDVLTGFTINSTAGFQDLRQLRLGGVSVATAVPEPGTWAMMLIGFGAIGASMRRRRSKQIPQFA
jgi:hypothetical protein